MTAAGSDLRVSRCEQGVAFWIHVTPRARRAGVGGLRADALRVSVQAPPVEGQANEACARALAEALGLPRRRVALDPGARGRRKRVRARGDPAALEARLRVLATDRGLG